MSLLFPLLGVYLKYEKFFGNDPLSELMPRPTRVLDLSRDSELMICIYWPGKF